MVGLAGFGPAESAIYEIAAVTNLATGPYDFLFLY